MLAAALVLVAGLAPSGAAETFHPIPLRNGLHLIPESQRSLGRLILGIEALPGDDRVVPVGSVNAAADPRISRLRDELYWLQFELLHGRIMTAAPTHSVFFVGIPRASKDRKGGEEASFRRFLEMRIGWSRETIERRVRFFPVDSALRYPRDMAEPIGRDGKERLVLAMGSDADGFYEEPLRSLVQAHPGDFVLEILPGVNTEGGDLSIVLLPDRGAGLVVGFHRIRRWIEKKYGGAAAGKLDRPKIEEAKRAFSRAFFGLEVMVVGEEELAGTTPESREVYHADMVLNIERGVRGVVAFVPTYPRTPVDSTTSADLPAEIRSRAQDVYDRAARLLEQRGYRVVRVPFRDHPDRSPAQVGAFADPLTGRQKLLLGRYPYHYPLPDGTVPQQRLQAGIDSMEAALAAWRREPGDSAWKTLESALDRVRLLMDAMLAIPNPDFDAERRAYEAEGIQVIPVQIYPIGEGGIHCLLLN